MGDSLGIELGWDDGIDEDVERQEDVSGAQLLKSVYIMHISHRGV